MSLEELAAQIKACSRCPLRETATQPVPPLGEVGAKFMLIGEAPGHDEDVSGVPFVGAAGKRLDKLLPLAGIDINDCFITNVCKCRPPANRQPRKGEVRECAEYLKKEIELVKPQKIIVLGSLPLSLFSPHGVTQMHGTSFLYEFPWGKIEIISVYHPAAALHQPRLWSVMLDDWAHLPTRVDASYTVMPNGVVPPHGDFSLDTENDPDGTLGQWSIAFRNAEGTLCVSPFYKQRHTVDSDGYCIEHNAVWDTRVLKNNGHSPPKKVVDTMIAAYCMGLGRQDVGKGDGDPGMVGGLGLKYLARRHLGMEMKTWLEVKDHPELVPEYNAADSVATLLLWEKWKDLLPKHFWTIDMPLQAVLMAMEDRGIAIDPKMLGSFEKVLGEELGKIDLPLNPFSNPQIQSYVYGELGVEPFKFTEGGSPSVDDEVLETIDDPVVRKILEYKSLYKEKDTYVDNYVKRMTIDGRIHPEFKQCRTSTGRLASSNPNLQNVPREGEMRKLFVAPAGKMLIRADWSQIELRVFAAITQEPEMLRAFSEGRSIHQETADATGLSYDNAKTTNFLMLYGGGAWKISQEFHMPIDQAKECIARYYRKYKGIEKYFAEIAERIKAGEKTAETLMGRKRRVDALYAEDWRVRKEGEREFINMPIQGTAAEIVKMAMIDLHYKYAAPIILQVHDELIFEAAEKDAKEYAHWLKEHLGSFYELSGVKFPVEVGVGRSWLECKQKENEIK